MRPTRQTIAIGTLIAFLAALAVVLARPLALAGTVLLGGWVVLRQYRFLSAVSRLDDSISVEQSVGSDVVRTREPVPVTLEVSIEQSPNLALEVSAAMPVGASSDDRCSVSIEPDGTGGSKTVDVTWPVAGTHEFSQATIVATDGYFTEVITAGTTPTVTVGVRNARNPEVETAVEHLSVATGIHEVSRSGSGIEPLNIRKYAAGDTPSRIDWNATARLGQLYVRDFEGRTTRETTLVVDHRPSLADGAPVETKLDYLREVALATTDRVHRRSDPIELLTVGVGGLTARVTPASSMEQYEAIKQRLLDLEPIEQTGERPRRSLGRWTGRALTETALRRRIEGLEHEGPDAFREVLVPYYERQLRDEHRAESDPLLSAVESAIERRRTPGLTILFTDDEDRIELSRTIRAARHGSNRVVVILAPTALYEPGAAADAAAAYRRYVSFEEYRRSIERMDRVDVVEIGPEDQFTTLLDAARRNDRPVGVA